jgi:hypothetical protein
MTQKPMLQAEGGYTKDERKEIRLGNFSLDGSSRQTEEAAFTPQDLQHSRTNTFNKTFAKKCHLFRAARNSTKNELCFGAASRSVYKPTIFANGMEFMQNFRDFFNKQKFKPPKKRKMVEND